LHGFLRLILALLIRSGLPAADTRSIQSQLGPGQLSDLTSLVEASQAGDPITIERSNAPRSLGLEPVDPEMKFRATPEIPGPQRFGPEMAGPRGGESGNVALLADLSGVSNARGGPVSPGLADTITAPFSGRKGLGRAELVQREGGTASSEKAVEDGLAWGMATRGATTALISLFQIRTAVASRRAKRPEQPPQPAVS
jgi:hypothetical protein